MWLSALGYTHCFTVAGGNSMHLLRHIHERFQVIAVNHEVSAGIGAEHFNVVSGGERAFVLVTTGPGLTNLATAVAGAWLESRELLVIAGAVKCSDLKRDSRVRQKGIQELSAADVFGKIAKQVVTFEDPCTQKEFVEIVSTSWKPRKGPVILEVPLDTQARPVTPVCPEGLPEPIPDVSTSDHLLSVETISLALEASSRPVLLIGGGADRALVRSLSDSLEKLGVPILLTWNAADYLPSDFPMYFGRPDNFGQRSANLILHQADLIVAVGTKLGLQLTGFDVESFARGAKIIQVDIDEDELSKALPGKEVTFLADCNPVLARIADVDFNRADFIQWRQYCRDIRSNLSGWPDSGEVENDRLSTQNVVSVLSEIAPPDAVFISSSSGTAEIAMMQNFEVRDRQRLISNKGLASMGYALPGAIGACFTSEQRSVFCVEGDGSMSQSTSELPLIVGRNLRLKIIVIDNGGYASISATQERYFDGISVGCSPASGLFGFDFSSLAPAVGMRVATITNLRKLRQVIELESQLPGPCLIVVKVSDDSPPLPRVTAELHNDGQMVSRPTWDMAPTLGPEMVATNGRFIVR